MTDHQSGRPAEPAWPNPAYAWYVVAILFAASIVSFLDRQIIAIMVSDIKADLGLSDFQIGLLQGPPFGVFYALMSVPIALAADQLNRRNIIALGVTFWSMATAACGLAGSFAQLFVARITVGVGEATLGPSAYSIISDYFPKARVPMAMSVFSMGNLTGIGLALMLGAGLLELINAAGVVALPLLGTLRPWQLAFVCVGLPGLALTLLILTVREPLRRGRDRSLEAAGSAAQLGEFFRHLRAHRRTFTHVLVAFTLMVMVAYANFGWVVQHLVRHFGTTQIHAGYWYGVVLLICGTSGTFFGGWFAGRLARAGHADATLRASLICTAPLGPVAIVTFLWPPSLDWALLLLGPCQFMGAVPAGLAGASMLAITPNQMRAKIASLYVFCSSVVGLSLGTTLVGLLTTYAFRSEAMLGEALAVVNGVFIPAAVLLLVTGLKPYRASLARVEEETAAAMRAAA
jgi:MFS family permease